MYEELGSVREPVDLSAPEALANAEELLVRQGYRIVHRTDIMVLGERQKRSGLFGKESAHVAVHARPRSEGGVNVTLQGNDREGVQDRREEWNSWAEGLPKVRSAGQQATQVIGREEPPTETAEVGAEEAESEVRERSSERYVLRHEREQHATEEAHERDTGAKAVDAGRETE